MNQRKKRVMLVLLASLAAAVAVLFLLSTFSTLAATPVVNSTGYNGSGNISPAPSGASVGRLSQCTTTDLAYPLAIPLAISDTFGPRLLRPLRPDGHRYGRYDFHRGIDLSAPPGTLVYAVAGGIVRLVEENWPADTIGSGNFVQLTHRDIDCETRYNHLSVVFVSEGDTVTPGQVIGEVGATGATYPHLHFEVRQGLTVTQRAAIHPLSTPFLSWTNRVSPTVTLRGVYTDATGLTALVTVTSPYTEPDVTAVSVVVSTIAPDPTIDYVDLNVNTTVVADLDDPLVNNVCIIPADLTAENGYSVTMAFRKLNYGPAAAVVAQVTDVDGWGSTDTADLIGGLEVGPPEQTAEGVPGETVTFTYTLINHTGATDTFRLTHRSAQGWPAVVTPEENPTLENGESVTVTVVVTLNTDRFGPPDCGLLIAEAQSDAQRLAAGFYRIYRDAYVSAQTGSDVTGTGSMTAPFTTIGYAIGQTDAGGTIHVAEGTYTENLTLTRTIDLSASYPVVDGNTVDWADQILATYSTTVTADDSGPVLVIDGDYGPLVEGFTFVKGDNDRAGGGVCLIGGAAPILFSNWILSNTAEKCGGGIYVGPSGTLPPTIISNTIGSNTSNGSSGGGICLEDRPTLIQSNRILDNEAATYGGGIYVTGSPALIQGNAINSNRAISNDGGGIYLTGGTTAHVLGNWILGNDAADAGGGVLVRSSGVYLANNLIRYNTAGNSGNGIRVAGSSAPRIYHNTLVANHPTEGAGLYIGSGSAPTVTNNIIARHAVGVHCSSPVTIYRNVLSNTVDVEGSCIVSNNIIADPRLRDEVHLASDSPAIDAGEYVSVDNDIDGIPRPMDGNCDGVWKVDIGAAEYYGCTYLPLVTKNFPATGFEYDVQGCLGSATTADDQVEIYVEGNDIVMHHYSAIYNCCAAIVVDLIDEHPLLKLVERETYPGGYGCFCTCPYDISARIPNLPSGNYRVEVWNGDQSHRYGWAEVVVP